MVWLAQFGRDAVPPLLKLLDSDDTKVRLNAARALGYLMGDDLSDAEPALLRRRDDPDPDVRRCVGRALRQMDHKRYPDPPERPEAP